jgi:hypothetical protein
MIQDRSPTEPPPPKRSRQLLLAAGALLAIVASGFWIYYTQFATPAANRELHEAVGRVMAEETARVVGHLGKVVIVTADLPDAPELKIQVAAFEKHLKLLGGISVKNKIVMDVGDNLKYRPGAGLSAKHFLKIARKNSSADAVVSFVGAPELTDSDLQQLKSMPKVIAETRSPEKLLNLLDKKILVAAIVPRFEFPAPGPRKPQTPRQWFDRYFQVLDPQSRLPVADALP